MGRAPVGGEATRDVQVTVADRSAAGPRPEKACRPAEGGWGLPFPKGADAGRGCIQSSSTCWLRAAWAASLASLSATQFETNSCESGLNSLEGLSPLHPRAVLEGPGSDFLMRSKESVVCCGHVLRWLVVGDYTIVKPADSAVETAQLNSHLEIGVSLLPSQVGLGLSQGVLEPM